MIDRYQGRNETQFSPGWVARFMLSGGQPIGEVKPRSRSARGFTIIEVLIVMVMVGILSAIAGPSWLTFVGTQRLKSVGNRALLAAREAQVKSKQQHRIWQVSFRDADGFLQYWVHPEKSTDSPLWQNMEDGDSNAITIDTDTSTLSTDCNPGDYCIRFADRGILEPEWKDDNQTGINNDLIGRIAFKRRSDQFDDPQRQCLVVTSLLGSVQLNRNDDCSS